MLLNSEKCHYICLGKDSVSDLLRFCGEDLEASELETLLRIQIDNKSKIRGITKYLKSARYAKEKYLVLFCNIISVQLLPTCLDVLLKKIEFTSEQCSWKSFCLWRSQLLWISNDQEWTYYSSAKYQCSHERNLSPPLIDSMFQVRKINYNPRHFQKIANTKLQVGLETISYRAPQLWNLVPTEIEDALSLSTYKEKIKSWYCENCPCRLCKTCIANVGFVLPNYFKIWSTTLAFLMVFFHFSVSCFIDVRYKLVL